MVSLTVSTDCLLEGADERLTSAIRSRLTIDNPKYIAAKRYGRWIGKRLKPELRYFDTVPEGLRFPRGFSNKAVLLARDIMRVEPRIIDQRRRLDDHEFSFQGQLRNYQSAAIDAVCARSFGVLEAGTGSGKTVMALGVMARRKQPTLVIVHTKELLYQWKERAREFLGVEAGLIGDGHFQISPLSIAIVNTARKRTDELVPHYGHLVVDECHRVPATLFTDVVSCFDSYYLLGLSATAFRSDAGMTRLIYYFMGDRIHTVDQLQLKVTGAVLKPKVIQRKTDFNYGYRGNYQALVTALTKNEGRNRMIADDIMKVVSEQPGGTVLVVSDRVSHCQVFVDILSRHQVMVRLLTGQTPPDRRSSIVEEVQAGKVQVLVATLQLISEGFDCSGLSSLFLTTPITFEGRLLQVIGRIMRPAENKTPCVYDYIDENVAPLRRSASARQKVLAGI